MHPIKIPQIPTQIHRIPHLEPNPLRKPSHLFPHLCHQTRPHIPLLQPLIRNPLTPPQTLRRINKCPRKINPHHLPAPPRHLPSRSPHRTTQIQPPLHLPRRKPPRRPLRKPQRPHHPHRPLHPLRQNLIPTPEMKHQILRQHLLRLINRAHFPPPLAPNPPNASHTKKSKPQTPPTALYPLRPGKQIAGAMTSPPNRGLKASNLAFRVASRTSSFIPAPPRSNRVRRSLLRDPASAFRFIKFPTYSSCLPAFLIPLSSSSRLFLISRCTHHPLLPAPLRDLRASAFRFIKFPTYSSCLPAFLIPLSSSSRLFLISRCTHHPLLPAPLCDLRASAFRFIKFPTSSPFILHPSKPPPPPPISRSPPPHKNR